MLQLTRYLRCQEASSSSSCRDAIQATDLAWTLSGCGGPKCLHLSLPKLRWAEWALFPRPAASPAPHRAERSARRSSNAERKVQWSTWQSRIRATGPAARTPNHRVRQRPPEKRHRWELLELETFLARSGSRLFLPPTLSLHGPKLSRKQPQGVVSRRHSAFGVNAAGRPELSSWRAAAAVTHREDAHADWGLQQARHLEPSHPATAGAGAGAGTFDRELLGQRQAPSAESQADRREHTTL